MRFVSRINMPEAARGEEAATPMWRTALQSVALFLAVQFVMKQFTGSAKGTTTTTTLANGTTVTVARAPSVIPPFSMRPSMDELTGEYNPVPQKIAPIWPSNVSLDISVFLSPSFAPPSLARPSPAFAVLEEKNFKYGAWNDTRDISTTFKVPKEVQNNGTLWAHFFVGTSGSTLDPRDSSYDPTSAFHFTKPVTQYLKKKKIAKVRNLLSGGNDKDEENESEEDTGVTIASYYHPNFTISAMPESGVFDWTAMHPGIREWFNLESSGARDLSGQNGWYYPLIYLNSFWQLKDHMTELNSTVTELPLNLHLNSLAGWKFTVMATMDFGMKDTAAKALRGETTVGGGDGSEFELIKNILLDSNIYLLATTVIVSILHTIFEMLAFKNDVSHWRNKKDNVGISVRTILANVFMQLVIFLYLLDNNENTSWMILATQGMGILIEAWKVTKTVDVRIRPTTAATTGLWRFLPYEIVFEDKHKLSETEKKTQEYDQVAFTYMYYIGVPLIIIYGIYSLMYESHKSWYSFIITTLVGSVYGMSLLYYTPSTPIHSDRLQHTGSCSCCLRCTSTTASSP